IDAGTNVSAAGIPIIDLAGYPRIANQGIDLGAYEFQQTPAPPGAVLTVTSTCDDSGNIYVLQPLTNAVFGNYHWEIDRNDGAGFVLLANDAYHSGATTAVLTIMHPTISMNGYKYLLQSGDYVSQTVTLRVSGRIVYVKQGATGANNGTNWNDAFTDL